MMGAGRWMLPRTEGIGAWKLCGSGKGEGFTPIPNTAVWAILATWPDEATARRQTADAPAFARFRGRADDSWTLFMTATSARGSWAGTAPFEVTGPAEPGPLAALTRATVKPSAALRFWRRVPDISAMIGSDPNVAFKIGIGELPWLHQVTFSIWPDADSMAAFARANGPHAGAIKAVREGNWFREELYARFRILGEAGSWDGKSPLAGLNIERHAA
jgi:spheroidene monooxygenase